MRPLAVLVAAAAAAIALAAPAAGGAVRCGEVETTPDEGHLHLLGDAPPVDYRTAPPASGWHYRERDRIRLGVAPGDAPLSEPEHVSVLAVGGVVVSHRDLPPDELADLADLVEGFAPRPVALTAYSELAPGEVALTAWRTLQRCDGLDREAVTAFVEDHAAAEPDFAMAGGDEEHDHGGSAGGAAPAGQPAASGPERLPGSVVAVGAPGGLALLAFALWRGITARRGTAVSGSRAT